MLGNVVNWELIFWAENQSWYNVMSKAGDVSSCCRTAILDALSPLAVEKESGVAGGEGAIYFWAKLPSGAHTLLC